MQLSFGDAAHTGKRKKTRREIFLAEMEQVVPWNALLALIAPHYPKMGQRGRQPYPLATMLRIHFLQQWYALSDPGMEEALYEMPVMRRFARLGGLDTIPDDWIDTKRYALFMARDVMRALIDQMQSASVPSSS